MSAPSPQVPVLKNDYSNPQQGSGMRTPSPADDAPNKTTMKLEEKTAKNLTRSNATRSPPTKKDSRKLFVGGLPSDGKFHFPVEHSIRFR